MRYVHEGLTSLESRTRKRGVPNSVERCYVAMPTSSKKVRFATYDGEFSPEMQNRGSASAKFLVY